jgi:hypothetical protein
MSRAKPKAERNALDFYATPDVLALAICRRLGESMVYPPAIIEPSAGHGPFVRAALTIWPGTPVVAIDSSEDRRPMLLESGAHVVEIVDWIDYCRRTPPASALVVGNPPFRDAEAHVRAGLDWLDEGGVLAFLLRLNFLGSAARIPFWRNHVPAEVIPIVPRPSFTGVGSDATEYALFVWRKGYEGPTTLGRPLLWKEAA